MQTIYCKKENKIILTWFQWKTFLFLMRSSRARFLEILEEYGKSWFLLKPTSLQKPRFLRLFLEVDVFIRDVHICEKHPKFPVFMNAEPNSGF